MTYRASRKSVIQTDMFSDFKALILIMAFRWLKCPVYAGILFQGVFIRGVPLYSQDVHT